jgi:hypothetical protein
MLVASLLHIMVYVCYMAYMLHWGVTLTVYMLHVTIYVHDKLT